MSEDTKQVLFVVSGVVLAILGIAAAITYTTVKAPKPPICQTTCVPAEEMKRVPEDQR